MVPFQVVVPNIHDLYVTSFQEKFGLGVIGYNVDNLLLATNYCIANNTHLDQALNWANAATSPPFAGEFSFRTFAVQSIVLSKLGRTDDAKAAWEKAVSLIPHDPKAILFEGWYLINVDAETALKTFQLNEKMFPEDVFTVNEGLARGYTATGDKEKAIKHWKIAIENVSGPDKQYLPYYQQALKQLEES